MPETIDDWLMFFDAGGVLSLMDWQAMEDGEREMARSAYTRRTAAQAFAIAAAIEGDMALKCAASGVDYEYARAQALLEGEMARIAEDLG